MNLRVGAVRRLVTPIAVGALLTVMGCGSDGSDRGAGNDDPGLAGVVRSPSLEVADVELPDVAAGGAPSTMRAAEDELLLVYFGYTFCPDICPTTMSDISVALAELPDDMADRVEGAMVTVDPERDTDEVLTAYLDHFFERSRALRTDDIARVDAAAEAFGVRYEVEDHRPGDTDYDVSHSAVTYVVDDTGTVVVEWPFGLDSLDMADDLRTLLTEEPAS